MTDLNGEIDYKRVREFIAALSAVLGLTVALGATVWQITGHTIEDTTLIGWLVTGLVLPITGGTVAAAITGTVLKRNGNGHTNQAS